MAEACHHQSGVAGGSPGDHNEPGRHSVGRFRSGTRRIRELARAGHPGPSLAITAMITLLAAEAAPHGSGPALVAPAVLAGQLSIGWSNDAFDAPRDAAAGRTDKPIAAGGVSRRAVGIVAGAALAGSVLASFALGEATGILNAVMMAAGWAYNAGLKSARSSGLMYIVGFGLIPAFAASTLPGHPWPRPLITAAAAVLGLGAHFANVLPDLAGDQATGVQGLPQRVAARYGPAAARVTALVLLLLASVLLVLAASGGWRRWLALAALGAAALLATVGVRGSGRLPFLAAIGIAAIDVALFAAGGVALV